MKSKISFEPLQEDAIRFLSDATEIDYFRCDFTLPCWMCVTARKDNRVVGVFIGEFMVWYEAHITCAISDPKFLTRRLLHAIFSTLFSQAVRITAMCRPENEDSVRILRHLGFLYEGCLRMGIDGRWDGLIFGMLRQECRWIRPLRPAMNNPNVRLMDAEGPTDLGLGEKPLERPDFDNVSGGEFRHLVSGTGLVVGVAGSLGGIGLAGSPADVPPVDAGAVLASVRGISHANGRGAVRLQANPIVDAADFPASVELPVSVAVERVRPQDALIRLRGEQGRKVVSDNAVIFNHAAIVRDAVREYKR